MHVLKFGGTSVGTAQRILQVARIIQERVHHHRVGVVLSAVSGVTNTLVESIQKAIQGDETSRMVHSFATLHRSILDELERLSVGFQASSVQPFLDTVCQDYHDLLRGVQCLEECPDRTYAQILSFGERVSAQIALALLRTLGVSVQWIDAAQFIGTQGSFREGTPVLSELENRFETIRSDLSRCVLMSGFIGFDLETGHLSLLGRNGSDYSASLMAVGLQAEVCEIWTDVDGIYTANPRQVPDAQLIPQMSYGEAMELAFYGAEVLHPKTTAALLERQIPLVIRNTFSPDHPGTRVSTASSDRENTLICGISSMNSVALFQISGAGMKGTPGSAARVFSTVSQCSVSIILISQASSEYSICFGVLEADAERVQQALETELSLELQARMIDRIQVLHNQSVICIVGDSIHAHYGVAGKFFSSLSDAHIPISVVSGSSERCISVVIDEPHRHRAVQAVHRSFFRSLQSIDLYLMGVGSVGEELLEQIRTQQAQLLHDGVEIQVRGMANSKRMMLSEQGIDLTDWRTQLALSPTESSLETMLQQATFDRPLNGVFVDCTSSECIAGSYLQAFQAGLHVVTPNKKANSSSLDYYQAIRQEADRHKRRFLYETNVGAGLPIIDTLKGLLKSGDQLTSFSGIVSGSLSYIFGLLEEGIPFSKAVRQALELKFTEPDPRDDLSGLDIARKLLIIAREVGMRVNLSDIQIEPLFPESFDATGTIENFLDRLSTLDSYFANQTQTAKTEQKVLRLVGEIQSGTLTIGIRAVDGSHPLYRVKGGENAFAFLTHRYCPIPLVIRGYGAGVAVTASGIFSDLLRTVDLN
jgi:aspartokinase/homoserine dehydrogenase 1